MLQKDWVNVVWEGHAFPSFTAADLQAPRPGHAHTGNRPGASCGSNPSTSMSETEEAPGESSLGAGWETGAQRGKMGAPGHTAI